MKTLSYTQLFHKEEGLEKLNKVLELLGRENCSGFKWTLESEGIDDIQLFAMMFHYSKEKSPVKYVEVFFSVKSDGFYITNSVTGTGIYKEEPEAAAAVAISYADSFTAYR